MTEIKFDIDSKRDRNNYFRVHYSYDSALFVLTFNRIYLGEGKFGLGHYLDDKCFMERLKNCASDREVLVVFRELPEVKMDSEGIFRVSQLI